ncbi:MAG: hypothetical protein NZO58_02400 [Gemmataceae bacterium]|nr:hypothetical protein [Gemmataceae bacterium]
MARFGRIVDQRWLTSSDGAAADRLKYAYDRNGNLTTDETGRQAVYDAWNRLVAVTDAGGNPLKTYAYDGLHRRISETANGTTTDFYYSNAWQVLEERVTSGGTSVPRVQYVWSPVYVDALILRDRDSNGDGTLDERLYVVQDANYNVTAIFDNASNVVERYVYDPFGLVTVLAPDWSEPAGSAFAWLYLHQGGRFDATSGLYHFRHRDYSPTLGRWTSLDPIQYDAGDVNLYRYVHNNTANIIDPSGLASSWFTTLVGAAVGTVVGGVSSAVSYTVTSVMNGNFSWSGLGGATLGGIVAGGTTGAIVGAGAGLLMGDPSASAVGIAITAGVSATIVGTATGGTGAAVLGGEGSAGQWVGQGWNGINTTIGWGWVGIGWIVDVVTGTNAMTVSLGNNAIQVQKHPWMYSFGAMTMGQVVVYGSNFGPNVLQVQGDNLVPVGLHEEQHTYQGQILGPLYFPLHGCCGVLSLIFTADWHKGNPLEWGPMDNPPRPWPW